MRYYRSCGAVMCSSKHRAALEKAIDKALAERKHPTDTTMPAFYFLAHLMGALDQFDPQLAARIQLVVNAATNNVKAA